MPEIGDRRYDITVWRQATGTRKWIWSSAEEQYSGSYGWSRGHHAWRLTGRAFTRRGAWRAAKRSSRAHTRKVARDRAKRTAQQRLADLNVLEYRNTMQNQKIVNP